MKLGLLMEAAQAQQGLAAQALERLREHTAGLDAVVREEIRATLIEELQARGGGEPASGRGAADVAACRRPPRASDRHCHGGVRQRHSARRRLVAAAVAWRDRGIACDACRTRGQHRTAQRAGWSRRAAPLRRRSSACACASTGRRHATAQRPTTWSCKGTERARGVAGNHRSAAAGGAPCRRGAAARHRGAAAFRGGPTAPSRCARTRGTRRAAQRMAPALAVRPRLAARRRARRTVRGDEALQADRDDRDGQVDGDRGSAGRGAGARRPCHHHRPGWRLSYALLRAPPR